MDDSSGKVLTDIEEIKILVAILEVFHLLPSAATCFLEDLIREVINLDIKLKRFDSSPFKLPLIKYLNKYPTEAVNYFFDHIDYLPVRRLFLTIFSAEGAFDLRTELGERSDTFESIFFQENYANELQHTGIFLCNCLLKHNSDWVKSHERLFGIVLQTIEPIGNQHLLYPERLNIVLILLSITKHFNYNGLLKKINGLLLSVALDPGVINGYDIQRFIFDELVCGCDDNGLQLIIDRLPQFLFDTSIATPLKVYGLRKFIIPALIYNQKNLSEFMVNDKFINFFDANVWASFADDKKPLAIDLSLSVELLQLSTLLIQRFPARITAFRKTLFKACNNLMKNGDVIIKYSAYVLLSTCLKDFECVEKLVSNYFTALLRSHQPESRVLVKQALDTLLKSKKLNSADSGTPFWITSIKKVLYEENILPNSFILIFNLFVSHPEIFGMFFDEFVGLAIITLPRLSLPPNGTIESRNLVIDLGEFIFKWYTDKNMLNHGSNRVKVEEDDVRSLLFNFYIKFSLSLVDNQAAQGHLFSKCCQVLSKLAGLIRISIDLLVFERLQTLDQAPEKCMVVCSYLEIMAIVLTDQSPESIAENFDMLEPFLQPWIKTDNSKIIKALAPVLKICFKSYKDVSPSTEVFPALKDVVHNLLQDQSCIFSSISYLAALQSYQSEAMIGFYPNVLNCLQRLIQNHLQTSQTFQSPVAESVSSQIIMIVELLASNCAILGDLRRQFISSLCQIIDSSTDVILLRKIFELTKVWITVDSDNAPTLKEKSNVMSKMIAFKKLADDQLFHDFLLFVAEVYSLTQYRQTELTMSLQGIFLLGLTSSNFQIQSKFFDIYDKSLEKNVLSRLKFILSIQNWDAVNESFWITQALKLLLSCMVEDKQVYFLTLILIKRLFMPTLPICHLQRICSQLLKEVHIRARLFCFRR